MSLLRRADRTRQPGDWPGNALFPLADALSEGDDASWRLRWTYHAPGRLLSLAMTRDAQLLAVGSRLGHVLFYDATGRLLWHTQVDGAVHRIALAEDARCLLVGTAEAGRAAHLFQFDGHLLHSFRAESETWGIDILPDASLIAVGGLNRKITLYDRAGTAVLSSEVSGAIRHARFMPDGGLLIATDDHRITALDRAGRALWQRQTGGRLWAGMCVAAQADLVLAGSNDHRVYALDRQGNDLWSCQVDGLVNAVALTPDGRWCAAVSAANTAYRFDAQGQMVWEQSFEQPVYSLALSDDGRFMALGVGDNALIVVDCADQYRLWTHDSNGRIYALAITPNGRTIAAATTGSNLRVFDNPLFSQGWEESLEREMAQRLVGRLTIRHLREAYAHDNNAGLVRWFAEFERSLRGHQFSVCQALVDEISDARSYHLSEGEQQVIRSLEGARWLVEGTEHHRQGHIEAARDCYERSKAIQVSLNNRDGEGQVIAVLSALPAPADEIVASVEVAEQISLEDLVPTRILAGDNHPAEPSGDAATRVPDRAVIEQLLDDIARRPRVLGTAEKLLEQRLIGAPPSEQLRIIVLARRSGYLLPILRGLESSERQVRAAASAALTFLQPGPDAPVITAMLQSPQSFVRWHAVRMIADRAENDPEAIESCKAQWWPLILNPESFGSLDALARRQVAMLVERAGSGDDTAWLIARLDDPDPDVRVAVVDALGKVGRREAVAALTGLPEATGFMGRSLASAAGSAVSEIESRHPLPSINRVYLCSIDPLSHRVVPESTVFLTDIDTVYGIVDLDHALPGTQLVVRWRQADVVIYEERVTLPGALPAVASVQELPPADSPGRPGTAPPRFGARNDGPPTFEPQERPLSRPFGSPRADASQRPSPFARDTVPGQGARPGLPSSGTSRFGSLLSRSAPTAPNPRDERPASRFSPSRGPAQSPTVAAPRPQAQPDRPSLFQRALEGAQRPQSSRLFAAPGRSFRSIFDDDDERGRGFRPFGRRSTGTLAVDPLENSEPGQENTEEQADRPVARPGASPRPAPIPPAPRPESGRAAGTPPEWLFTEDDEDNVFGGGRSRRSPFSHPNDQETRGPLPGGLRDRLRRDSDLSNDDELPVPPERLRRSSRPGTISRLAFALPRPADGWPQSPCQIEIVIESEQEPISAQADFRFVDGPRIARLESGALSNGRGATFTGAQRFLTGTGQIACRVFLTDAPVNTRVVARCYGTSVHEGEILMGEVAAQTRVEIGASVILHWDSSGWLAGNYRIEADVEGFRPAEGAAPQIDQRQAVIALIERVGPARISLCHQIDDQNGPVGIGWPFVPGATPWCVVEFDDPPPEMSVEAAWYGREGLIHRSMPLIPAGEKGKRAAFELVTAPGETLVPGFYSVVIEGNHVAREERIFEVLPLSWQHRIGPRAAALWTATKSHVRRLSLFPFLKVLGGVLLFALALAGVDAVLAEVLTASQRRHDELLWLGDLVGGMGAFWAIAWVAAGSVYSALCMRVQQGLADARERTVFNVLNPLLVYAGGGLLWYQLGYMVCAPGYLEPDALYGAFGPLRWIAPMLAWGALPVGLVMADWYRHEQNAQPFTVIGASVVIMMAALTAAGYLAALSGGLAGALVGVIPDGLLTLVGVENQVVQTLIIAGASLGFVFGALVYAWEPARAFWSEWRSAQSQEREGSRTNSLLDYGLETIGIDQERWRKIVMIPGAVILVLGAAAVAGLIVAFDPVVIPVLKALYDPARGRAFEQALNGRLAMLVTALALWLVWPGAVWAVYRGAEVLGADAAEKRLARWLSAAALGTWISVPVMIALVSRTELVRGLSPDQMIYWANRVAVVMVALACAGWLALVPKRELLDGVKWQIPLPESAIGWTIFSLCVASVVLWPVWMWAATVGLLLVVSVIGAQILRWVN